MSVVEGLWLFTVDDYYRMQDAGILSEDDRVELIEGKVVRMSPIGSRHASSVDTLCEIIKGQLGHRIIVRVQNPVRINEHSEVQPDLAIVKPRNDRYRNSHPVPDDVFFLIEIADTTIKRDRSKIAMYARAGVGEVWLVDLEGNCIEIHSEPRSGYTVVHRYYADMIVVSTVFPDLRITASDILMA
jgi:Uma2 family endonuclease